MPYRRTAFFGQELLIPPSSSLFQALAEHRIAHVLGCGLGGGADYLDAFSPRVGRPADYLGACFPLRLTPLLPGTSPSLDQGRRSKKGYVMSSRLRTFQAHR